MPWLMTPYTCGTCARRDRLSFIPSNLTGNGRDWLLLQCPLASLITLRAIIRSDLIDAVQVITWYMIEITYTEFDFQSVRPQYS